MFCTRLKDKMTDDFISLTKKAHSHSLVFTAAALKWKIVKWDQSQYTKLISTAAIMKR